MSQDHTLCCTIQELLPHRQRIAIPETEGKTLVLLMSDFILISIDAIEAGAEFFRKNWWWIFFVAAIIICVPISVISAIVKRGRYRRRTNSGCAICLYILGLPILCWGVLFGFCIGLIRGTRKVAKKTADGISKPDPDTSLAMPKIPTSKYFFFK